MIDTLYGRPFRDWAHIDDIMKERHLDGPQELRAALNRKVEVSIDVRDEANPARLLGRLVRKPTEKLTGDRLDMMVRARLGVPSFSPLAPEPAELNISRITFRVSYRRTPDGYGQIAEFLTDTPLGVLMLHPDFRLPGENEQQASHRLHMRSF